MPARLQQRAGRVGQRVGAERASAGFGDDFKCTWHVVWGLGILGSQLWGGLRCDVTVLSSV